MICAIEFLAENLAEAELSSDPENKKDDWVYDVALYRTPPSFLY